MGRARAARSLSGRASRRGEEIATDVVVAGNVVEDWDAAGQRWSPAGPSLYSARMALALGAQVTLVTSVPYGYDRSVFEGLTVREVPAPSAPRYENTYTSTGTRRQRLLDEGQPLEAAPWESVPPADVLIIAPAYHELASPPPVTARVVGVSLQGLLRDRDANNRVTRRRSPWASVQAFARPGTLAFLSEEDTRAPVALCRELVKEGCTALLTHGYRGATMFGPGVRQDWPAAEAETVVDPTGAGDVFSTSFAIRYAETSDMREAMRFALCAGALAVEGAGLAGIPVRAAIESRLPGVAA